MRKAYLLLVLAVFFSGFAFSVVRMEGRLATDMDILLPLAPVDPRALLLGDYMDLDYAVNRDIAATLRKSRETSSGKGALLPAAGLAVMRAVPLAEPVDPDVAGWIAAQQPPPEARFVRLDNGEPLAPGEFFLAYKIRNSGVLTAASAFYFQEGYANAYEKARFGRVKVHTSGQTLLVGLCDVVGLDIRPEKERPLKTE